MKHEGTCQGHAIHVFTHDTIRLVFSSYTKLRRPNNNLGSEEEEEEEEEIN